jgi:hypothetical protein
MATDIGESIVGSYLRYLIGCEVVVYNTQTPNVQGELDVIGIKTAAPRNVWLCEVITPCKECSTAGATPTPSRRSGRK